MFDKFYVFSCFFFFVFWGILKIYGRILFKMW
jgi:hypothetical protein